MPDLDKKEQASPLAWGLFLAYCGVMLWLLFGREGCSLEGSSYWEVLPRNLNLRPFYTIGTCFRLLAPGRSPHLISYAVVNLYGNVLVFVPWGFFLPRFWKKQRGFGWFLLTTAGTVAGVELAQLFSLRGSCDVDDLILNLLGGTLGFVLFGLWRRSAGRAAKK